MYIYLTLWFLLCVIVLYGLHYRLHWCIRRVENKQSEGKIVKPGALSLPERRGIQLDPSL